MLCGFRKFQGQGHLRASQVNSKDSCFRSLGIYYPGIEYQTEIYLKIGTELESYHGKKIGMIVWEHSCFRSSGTTQESKIRQREMKHNRSQFTNYKICIAQIYFPLHINACNMSNIEPEKRRPPTLRRRYSNSRICYTMMAKQLRMYCRNSHRGTTKVS